MKRLVVFILCITIIFSSVSIFAVAPDDEIKLIKQRITAIKNNKPYEDKTNMIFVNAINHAHTEYIMKQALIGFNYTIIKQYNLTKSYLVEFESIEECTTEK